MTLLNTKGQFGISDYRVSGVWFADQSVHEREEHAKNFGEKNPRSPKYRTIGGGISIVITAVNIQDAMERVAAMVDSDIDITKVERVG